MLQETRGLKLIKSAFTQVGLFRGWTLTNYANCLVITEILSTHFTVQMFFSNAWVTRRFQKCSLNPVCEVKTGERVTGRKVPFFLLYSCVQSPDPSDRCVTIVI